MSLLHRATYLSALLAGCALLPVSSLAQLSFQTHTIAPGGGIATPHADFNGDGREDLANGKTLLLSNGNGTYQAGVALPSYVDTIGDFNHDGKLDFISYRNGGAVNGASLRRFTSATATAPFRPGRLSLAQAPLPLETSFIW